MGVLGVKKGHIWCILRKVRKTGFGALWVLLGPKSNIECVNGHDLTVYGPLNTPICPLWPEGPKTPKNTVLHGYRGYITLFTPILTLFTTFWPLFWPVFDPKSPFLLCLFDPFLKTGGPKNDHFFEVFGGPRGGPRPLKPPETPVFRGLGPFGTP